MKDIQKRQKEIFLCAENDSSNDGSEDEMQKPNELALDEVHLGKGILLEHKNCKYMQFNNKVLRGRFIGKLHIAFSLNHCLKNNHH